MWGDVSSRGVRRRCVRGEGHWRGSAASPSHLRPRAGSVQGLHHPEQALLRLDDGCVVQRPVLAAQRVLRPRHVSVRQECLRGGPARQAASLRVAHCIYGCSGNTITSSPGGWGQSPPVAGVCRVAQPAPTARWLREPGRFHAAELYAACCQASPPREACRAAAATPRRSVRQVGAAQQSRPLVALAGPYQGGGNADDVMVLLCRTTA